MAEPKKWDGQVSHPRTFWHFAEERNFIPRKSDLKASPIENPRTSSGDLGQLSSFRGHSCCVDGLSSVQWQRSVVVRCGQLHLINQRRRRRLSVLPFYLDESLFLFLINIVVVTLGAQLGYLSTFFRPPPLFVGQITALRRTVSRRFCVIGYRFLCSFHFRRDFYQLSSSSENNKNSRRIMRRRDRLSRSICSPWVQLLSSWPKRNRLPSSRFNSSIEDKQSLCFAGRDFLSE